ncbi:MAG: hypothetical protein ABSA02_28505 [Trebonia sp.]
MTDDFDEVVERVIARFDPGQSSVREDIGALQERGVASWTSLVAVLADRAAGEDRATACWLIGRRAKTGLRRAGCWGLRARSVPSARSSLPCATPIRSFWARPHGRSARWAARGQSPI